MKKGPKKELCMSVVKRAVAPLARPAEAAELGDLEAGAPPSHFVSPGHADVSGRNLWIVGFILA